MILSKLNEDIKISMKAGNGFRVSTLKGLKSSLEKNYKEKNPKEDLQVTIQYKGMLEKALGQYAGKFDKMKEINSELEIIAEYLPKQMSKDAVFGLIGDTLAELGPTANVGAMMKILKPKTEGRFSGQELSKLVKESLI